MRREEWTKDLDEEMRLHVEMRAQTYQERGMAAADAALAAKRRFGNPLALRENTRDVWTAQWVESMWKDVMYSTRRLVRDRAATLAIVMTLALGIGANSAMFTLIDRVLFKPAPVAEPDSLAWLLVTDARSGRLQKFSYPGYRHLAQDDNAFSAVAAFTGTQFSLGGETPERIRGMVVSGQLLRCPRRSRERRQNVPARGGWRTGRASRGGVEPCALDEPVWRGRVDCRQTREAQWPAVHGRGRRRSGIRGPRTSSPPHCGCLWR